MKSVYVCVCPRICLADTYIDPFAKDNWKHNRSRKQLCVQNMVTRTHRNLNILWAEFVCACVSDTHAH